MYVHLAEQQKLVHLHPLLTYCCTCKVCSLLHCFCNSIRHNMSHRRLICMRCSQAAEARSGSHTNWKAFCARPFAAIQHPMWTTFVHLGPTQSPHRIFATHMCLIKDPPCACSSHYSSSGSASCSSRLSSAIRDCLARSNTHSAFTASLHNKQLLGSE